MSTIWNKIFRWVGKVTTIFNAAAANGTGTEVDIAQFQWVGIMISTSNFTGTIKFYGSFNEVADVNFANAASAANPYEEVAIYHYEDASKINGTTGIAYAGDTSVKNYTVNASELRSLNAKISGFAAGTITVKAHPMNNQ